MKNQAKPTENWDTKSLDQTFAAMGLNWLQIKAIKQFIAKTLKEHDEKIIKELNELSMQYWIDKDEAMDKAIELVKGGK